MTAVKGRGKRRFYDVQAHRLAEFRRVFDRFLDGKATADHVSKRAFAMLDVGLPGQRPRKRRKG